MRNSNALWVAAGAAMVAAAVGGWLLSSSDSSGPVARNLRSARVPAAGTGTDAVPSGTPAYAALPGRNSASGPAGTSAPAESPELLRAREMLRRLQDAVGPEPGLPEALRRDLLAFLTESEAQRDALFRILWEPGTSRLILGHVKLFLNDLQDRTLRDSLVAALESFDPDAAHVAAVKNLSGDPALLAAELRATGSPSDRAARIFRVARETARDPRVAEALLELARTDPSEEVRQAAYNRIAYAGLEGGVDLLASVVADAGLSEKERMAAAAALPLHPKAPSLDAALSLWERSPESLKPVVIRTLGRAGSSDRVDGTLVEALTAPASDVLLRRASANAIGNRLFRLPAGEARDLGARVAAAMRTMDPETTVSVLEMLGGSVMKNDPLREAVVELHRTSPKGGVIQLAIAASPALRVVAGLN